MSSGAATLDRDSSSLDALPQPSVDSERDETQYAPDPADSTVEIGEVPALEEPVSHRRPLLPPMPTDAMRGWFVTALITIVGGFLRFWQMSYRTDGGTPLFDEKYYAVQAAEMIRTGGVDDNQAYGVIVHPPLGKQLIALSEMIFGYNPIGWRFASAVLGTLCIFLVIRVVRRMTRSTLLGGIAGVLLICDGVSQVMSRTALLDSIQVAFVLGAFVCLIVDRDQVRARLARAVADGSMDQFSGGVPLGARWWRFGCGFLLGCATAVKWNGAYWVVAFGILSVVWDVLARRQYGVRHPVTAVLRRDFFPSLWSLAVIPVVTYVASYWAWFLNETGWDRHVEGGGPLGALHSLLTMTLAMLKTTAKIVTPDNPDDWHPWESKPFAWPLSTRPVLYYLSGGQGTTGCGAGHEDCVKRILLVGTPMLWWMAFFVAGWALWRAIARLDWRYMAVLVAYGAGYLPWFTIFDRQMYFFYMTPVAPFLIIGITLVLGDILGRAGPRKASLRAASPSTTSEVEPGAGPAPVSPPPRSVLVGAKRLGTRVGSHTIGSVLGTERRLLALAVVSIYVGLVVANFIWMWPILVGNPITPERLRWETWLPSWG